MIPSLPFVKDVIDFVDPHDEIKVVVGGGPVSKVWADESGADGYGDDAIQAVEIVKQLLN
jgi:methanogenic corrinoid protein MtbC1